MRDSRVRGGSAMTRPGIALDFTPFLRSREATHWRVWDGGARNRPIRALVSSGRSNDDTNGEAQGALSPSQVFDHAYGEKGHDTMGIAHEREAASFNELLSRMIFLA